MRPGRLPTFLKKQPCKQGAKLKISLGKAFIIFTFLLSFSAAVFFVHSGEEKSLRLAYKKNRQEGYSVLRMKNFEGRRYLGSDLQGLVKAGDGAVIEPNKLLLEENVQLSRLSDGRWERGYAERALVVFNAASIKELMAPSKRSDNLKIIEFNNSVRVEAGNQTLGSDYAQYSQETNQVSSTRPVSLLGPGSQIMGSEGFVYSLTSSAFEIFGEITGAIDSSKVRKK